MRSMTTHQYIQRGTSRVRDEALIADRMIRYIYSDRRESASTLFKVLTSARVSRLLAYFNFDFPMGDIFGGGRSLLDRLGVDTSECLDAPGQLDTARKVFERKIRYWETRPMPEAETAVVSPADAKMVAGSFAEGSLLFIKEKFFHFDELLGTDRQEWLQTFREGDFAVFRLTPDKYHYNHTPVSGRVLDIYEIDGQYHSCNPSAVVALATPFSKNKRVVTVIDTDVEGGSRVGRVAMIEITALMIGDIVQCYSAERYDSPQDVKPGMMLKKGQPKSLYRPGSSVDVLVFENGRIQFSADILRNLTRTDIQSRFSRNFDKPLVETEVTVRSEIAAGIAGEEQKIADDADRKKGVSC